MVAHRPHCLPQQQTGDASHIAPSAGAGHRMPSIHRDPSGGYRVQWGRPRRVTRRWRSSAEGNGGAGLPFVEMAVTAEDDEPDVADRDGGWSRRASERLQVGLHRAIGVAVGHADARNPVGSLGNMGGTAAPAMAARSAWRTRRNSPTGATGSVTPTRSTVSGPAPTVMGGVVASRSVAPLMMSRTSAS